MAKIRGYRIDIGEIESRLREHPRIADAAVAFRDRAAGEKSLVGHVVVCSGATVTVSDIKEFLRARLPDYMIPDSFQFLAALPLTNGKLDRRTLANPDNQRPSLVVPYNAPRNELESRLAGIWSEVLGIELIGIRDNFFDLGGSFPGDIEDHSNISFRTTDQHSIQWADSCRDGDCHLATPSYAGKPPEPGKNTPGNRSVGGT